MEKLFKQKYVMTHFEKFLINRNLLERYENNLRKAYNTNVKSFISKTYRYNFISSAFDWMDSSEGLEFWRKIESEWIKCLRNNSL